MTEAARTDVVIAGGGISGLCAAAAFGTAGFQTLCIDPEPPVITAADPAADLRSTAFLQPAVDLLSAAGLWERLLPQAAPLQIMRIVDAGGADGKPRLIKDFDAKDVSELPFGWNLPNWLLRREMVARLQDLPSVRFVTGISVAQVFTRTGLATVVLSDGNRIETRLLIGADGRNSTVRAALGIGVRTWRYGQKALTCAVTHETPHDNISTEVHRTGGPFTLVPLPDRAGLPCSAVVWMDHARDTDQRLTMAEAAFEAAMTERSAGLYGALRLASRRSAWPIISQLADRLTGERTALMAEAAHVVPPIGAQGLNMSLADLALLLQLAEQDRDGLGSTSMLDRYHKGRHGALLARVLGIDALNRASMIGSPTLRDLRAGALASLYALEPVRRQLMRTGLGL